MFQVRKLAAKAALVTAAAFGSVAAFAQAVAPTTPVEIITSQSANYMDETKAVLFAGAGLLIGALLIKSLVQLAIRFFQRG